MEHTLLEQLLDFYNNDLSLELDSDTLDNFSFQQEEY